LPSAVGSHAHVLVTSRPHPALPPDVEIDHPIRRVRPVVLQPSPAAARLEERAGQELTEVLAKGVPADARRPLDRKVLAFLTAARGALAPADLASLTGADLNAVDSVLAVRISRVVSSIGFGEDGRYGFAHESLLLASEQTFARREDELEENTARIVEWAADWQHRGWPIEQTPTYLLDSYPEMLAYRQLQGNRFAPSAVSPQELVHDPGWIAAAVARLGVERAHGIIRLALDPSRVAP